MPKKQTTKRQKGNSFLTRDFLERQQAALEKELTECQELQKRARERVTVRAEGYRETADLSTDQREREAGARYLDMCREIISQVREAITLVKIGLLEMQLGQRRKYGKCADCGRQISHKRLKTVPWAKRCIPCQEKKDTTG